MAKNTKQYERLLVLDQLLKSGRKATYSVPELLAYLSNSAAIEDPPCRKTLYNDLAYLRDTLQAPLINTRGRWAYTEAFSLQSHLSTEAIELTATFKDLFAQLAHLPPLQGFEDFYVRLQAHLGPSNPVQPILLLHQSTAYKGLVHLNTLYQAIRQRQCLTIHFRDFQKPERVFLFSPYLLKEHGNRWHVYGFDYPKNKIYNLPLDRILTIRPSEMKYREQLPQELSYLKDLIGFTYVFDKQTRTYASLQRVVMRVSLPRANYLLTKPMHSSQKLDRKASTDTHLVFEMMLYPNLELVGALLGYGADLEVLEPAFLRQQLRSIAAAMLQLYNS